MIYETIKALHRRHLAFLATNHGLQEGETIALWAKDLETLRAYNRQNGQKGYYSNQAQRIQYARDYRARMKHDPVWLEKSRAYHREKMARKLRTDLQCRLKFRMRNRIWMALDRGVGKCGPTVELLGCTIPDLIKHIEKQWLPGMSWENYGKHGWHIDHRLSCASFDLTDPAQQRICFHHENLRPLWAQDNLSKGTKLFGPTDQMEGQANLPL